MGSLQLHASPDRKLKVMLINESCDRNQSLADMLSGIDCEVVAFLSVEGDLLQQIKDNQPDVVIIDVNNPDRDILENLGNIQSTTPRPMVMFSQDDDGYTIRRAIEAGISAYVVDGIQEHRIRPILDAAIARFDRYQLLQRQLDLTREELGKQQNLDRAKRILMKHRKIDEENAYRIIRKTAMDRNLKTVDVAREIIAAAELLGGRN